jgi:hypothetical protein
MGHWTVQRNMDNSLFDDWIRPLGEEYPAAIQIAGTRIPLAYETRFKRHYVERKPNVESHTDISRRDRIDNPAATKTRMVHLERRRPRGLLRLHA